MHRATLNELRLSLSIIPVAPLLIASGADGSFVRAIHPRDAAATAYLPGANLKGALRAAANQVMSSAAVPCCETLALCTDREAVKQAVDGATVYRESCGVCRVFGNRALSSHLWIADAFPGDPLTDLESIDLPDENGHCESVQGVAFYSTLTLRNFERWQFGLLEAVFTRINAGLETLGANRSLGMGRVMIRYTSAVITYFGFYNDQVQTGFAHTLHGVGRLVDAPNQYDFTMSDVSDHPDLPNGTELNAGFGFTDVSLTGNVRTIHATIHKLFERQTPAWEQYKRSFIRD